MKNDKLDHYRWWTLTDDDGKGNELAATVFTIIDCISKAQTKYWKANFLFAQMYENIDSLVTTSAFPLFQSFGLPNVNQAFNSKLTFNVVKSCIDSVVAKIAKNKPRVKFVTSGADYKLRKKSENLTTYLDGVFYESDVYSVAVKVFKDSCIFGTGCMKITFDEHEKKFQLDRVIVPLEIIIDNAEAQDGKPKQMHQRKLIAKDVLKACYPEKAQEIDTAESVPNYGQYSEDRVVVVESWKLPSFKGAKDGKHCININATNLFDEEYDKNYFPFVFINWTDRVNGFFGYGLAEELTIMQLMITRIHKMISAGQAIASVPRVFAYANSIKNKSAFYDAGIIELQPGSQAPVFNASPAAPQDLYNWQENLVNKSYQMSGVSQLSAAAQKPSGLDSGAALREYNDQNSERFAIQATQYESMFLNIAKIIIDLSRDVYKDDKELSSKAMSANQELIYNINFGDANMKDSEFAMQCFPVSKLPTTPEGRLSFITDMVKASFISPAKALELMEIPDIKNFFELRNASNDVVAKDLDRMVEDEEYNDPVPQLDLQAALEFANSYYLKSINDKSVSAVSLEMIKNYSEAIIGLINANQPPPPVAPDPNAAPADPMGVPEAPPVSDLLPVGQ